MAALNVQLDPTQDTSFSSLPAGQVFAVGVDQYIKTEVNHTEGNAFKVKGASGLWNLASIPPSTQCRPIEATLDETP